MFHTVIQKIDDALFILGAGIAILTVAPVAIALDWIKDQRFGRVA